jgi:hypothetical protein
LFICISSTFLFFFIFIFLFLLFFLLLLYLPLSSSLWVCNKVVDESSWTDVRNCKQWKKWYFMLKMEAEKAAWGSRRRTVEKAAWGGVQEKKGVDVVGSKIPVGGDT